ncbi:FecCD family ABC transporter permease [Candidatus Margulisiibacteriota bacterium]
MKKVRNQLPLISLLLASLVILVSISLAVGPARIGVVKVLNLLIQPDSSTASTIVWNIRLPRTLLALLVGAALAVSGVILQGLLRNPLADPYIMGVSAGGAVGAAIAIILGLNIVFYGMELTPLLSFLFALLAVLVVYRLANFGGRASPEALILAGVAVSAFATAVLVFVVLLTGNMQTLYFWLLGSLADASWTGVYTMIPYVVVGVFIAFFYSKDLNALLLGEDMAKTLGVEVEWVKVFLLGIASFMTAAAVSICGIIGFAGLIVPHIVRLIVGPNHRVLMIVSILTGMVILLFADIVAKVAFMPAELPIGMVMAVVGAPFFLYILRRRRFGR